MLAMLERCITDRGGTYALCDTDSMAPVATEHGGLVPCAGGTERLPDGTLVIRALSWADVDAIVERFDALKPYDADAVPGHVLEVEKENFGVDGRQQLWSYGISAKRYALYNLSHEGHPILRKWSEHGLGHLLNPTDPDSDDRDWMHSIWEGIVREAYGLSYDWPEWLSRPALTRITTSSPALMHPFRAMNAGKFYADQIKPFNFILAAHRDGDFRTAENEPPRGLLVHPYETNARKWETMDWIDRDSGRMYRVTTTEYETMSDTVTRVKSYADVLTEYRYHPEWKSLPPDGQRNAKQARGLLKRRPVRATMLTYVGKDSNKVEEVDAGLVHEWDEVRNEYRDSRHDPWQTLVMPVLKEMDASTLAKATGISVRHVRNIQKGDVVPHADNRKALIRAAASYARERLPQPAPHDDFAALAAFLDIQTETQPTTRLCPVCQQPFTPTSSQQRYCSQRCKKRAARARGTNESSHHEGGVPMDKGVIPYPGHLQ